MPVKEKVFKILVVHPIFQIKKGCPKRQHFWPFFPRPAKQATQTAAKQVAQTATQSPVSESLMLMLGHVDAATRSNATGHAASLSVDHARTHDSSAPTRPLAPNATLPPTTRAPRRRTHYAVIIETLSPPSLYPYVLARPRPMELSIVLSGQPSFSFSDRSPVVSYNLMDTPCTPYAVTVEDGDISLDEVESTVLGDHASGVRYPLRYAGRTRFVYGSASRMQCLCHNENLSILLPLSWMNNGHHWSYHTFTSDKTLVKLMVFCISVSLFHLSLQSGYQDNTQCCLSLS
ncbi:hypothetical protein K439DRAFT_1624023 [Ramaria rubella]|nr:hypothetical protein K439DRAFT_1624023 [Ramaria rubella]